MKSSNKSLAILSVALIVCCAILAAMLTVVLCTLDVPSMPEGVSGEVLIEALGVFGKVFVAINYAIIVLAAIQVLTMLCTFIFNLRRLGEYVGYYLTAFLSLACTAGSWFYLIYLVARVLADF